MNLENRTELEKARELVPFLKLIPDDIYFGLDHREWILPEGIVSEARGELEEALGNFVMTYNRGMFLKDVPLEKHLCANLEGAHLTEYQREILDKFENVFRSAGVSFVVYKKPLSIIPVEESFIYQELAEV